MNEELTSYAITLMEDTHLNMDEYSTPEVAFTATVLEKISELLDCTDPTIGHCIITNKKGSVDGEIHAYAASTNGEVLYLFYSFYNPQPEIQSKNNTESQIAVNRPQGFYQKAIRGAHFDCDESSREYEAFKFIYDNQQKFQTVNIIILSNYIINNLQIKKLKVPTKSVYLDTWDLKKIYGNTHSLSDHVAIDIDFESEEYQRYKIHYLQMESTQYGYKCILAMFPAKLLYQLYDRYNTNLLYNNVRYFLGLKGSKEKKPNVAMLETLRKENEMFLAYNNGLTALAKGVETKCLTQKTDVTDPEGTTPQYISMGVLDKILDFRIINGGQTTAAIFNARKQNNSTTDTSKKVNLLGVYVQVKLIISEDIEKYSSKITLYSNFQNKVKYSDFSVSNEFNIQMEKLSRTIMSPSDNNEPTYWFYERLRGQYDEHKKRLNTKQDRDYFDFQFPSKKRFTKEDIAKVWSNWNHTPFDAVKGASTTYGTFMKGIVERSFVPDEKYYKESIALIILYKFLLARPENKQYANGKASVIAYAMSMLNQRTFGKFDLLKVWQRQELSEETKLYLNTLCDHIYDLFQQRAAELNTSILSYGKSKPAYEFLKSQQLNGDIHMLDKDLI